MAAALLVRGELFGGRGPRAEGRGPRAEVRGQYQSLHRRRSWRPQLTLRRAFLSSRTVSEIGFGSVFRRWSTSPTLPNLLRGAAAAPSRADSVSQGTESRLNRAEAGGLQSPTQILSKTHGSEPVAQNGAGGGLGLGLQSCPISGRRHSAPGGRGPMAVDRSQLGSRFFPRSTSTGRV